MKKGFTLIELLAVIVILAIIALIATPIILNIINDSKKSADERSAELYISAVEQAVVSQNMKMPEGFNPKTCDINSEGNLENCIDANTNSVVVNTPVEVNINGTKPTGGSITFSKGSISTGTINFPSFNATINNGKISISYENLVQTQYTKYYSRSSGTVGGTLPADADLYLSNILPNDTSSYFVLESEDNQTVENAYVCFQKNGFEYCLKGYDVDAFSDNYDTIREAFANNWGTWRCSSDDSRVSCSDGDNYLAGANATGEVEVVGGIVNCHIYDSTGSFSCFEE